MKKSNEITEHLANGEVTNEMLAMAAYSYNKRAKNMRDREAYYRRKYYFNDIYGNANKLKEKKDDYYRRKDECLAFAEPTALHIVERDRKVQVWDAAHRFYEFRSQKVNEYYKLYVIGSYRFHQPIAESEFEVLKKTMPVEEIENFETDGEEVVKLMSVQTADKIRNGLMKGEYRLVG